jgi:hypothetical protein
MKYSTILLAILFILPLSAALQITSPTSDITASNTPIDVNVTWTGNSTNYTVLLQTANTTIVNQTVQTTNQTYNLDENNYTLTIIEQNTSVTQNFSVKTQEQLKLKLTTEDDEYAVGDEIMVVATTNKPVSALLTIQQTGSPDETYTLSISDSLSMYYEPKKSGEYKAVLSAQGQTTTTTWNVVAPDPLTIDFTYPNSPLVNKKTTFTATASGGEQPYSYQWIFSDDTTSSGKQTDHFFFETGPHNTTLIVTDNTGTQKSLEKSFTVTERVYNLDINLIDQKNQLLQGFIVQITDSQENTHTQTSNIDGQALFEDLSKNNYTISVTKNDISYYNTTVELKTDISELYALNYVDEETNTTEVTNQTTIPPPESIATQETELQVSAQEIEAQKAELQEQQEKQAFKEKQDQAKEALREKKFSLRLDSTTDEVLTHLNEYKTFDEAIAAIDTATNQKEIEVAKKNLVTKVTISNEEQTIFYPEISDLQEALQQYFTAAKITEQDEQETYRYNIKRLLKNVSITQRTYTAVLTYPSRVETHSFVGKDITAPKTSTYVEVIPESFSKASELTVSATHTELGKQVIELDQTQYLYSAQTTSNTVPATLVIPSELIEAPLFTGFLSFDVDASNAAQSLIYLFVIAMAVAGVIVGKKMKSNTAEHFDAFCELTDQAIDQLHQGQAAAVTELTPDIQQLHQQLPKEQQEQTQELITHLQDETTKYHFTQATQYVYSIGEHADINMLSSAYEDVLHAYQQLNQHDQEELQEHIQQLETYLDTHITQ